MKWIKASERLPEKEDQYYICISALSNFKKVTYFNGRNFEHQFTNRDFVWLDESEERLIPSLLTPLPLETTESEKQLLQEATQIIKDKDKEIEKIGNESMIFEMDLRNAKIEIERLKGLIPKQGEITDMSGRDNN